MPKKKSTPTNQISDSDVQNPTQQYYPPTPKGPSNLLIVLLIAVSFLAGYLFFRVRSLEQGKATGTTQQQAEQPPQRPTELKIKKPEADEHWRGSKDVRYVWVEYSDLECPFCKRIHPDLIKLMDGYKDKVAWVFRHFPLAFHPKAQKSGEAVECAHDQGGDEAFWKLNDAIFEKMPDLELSQLPSLASEVGLDATTLKDCLDSGKFEKKVKDQQAEGTKAGVQATPTGVIYDLKTGKTLLVEGALPYENLKQNLDNFLAQNK
ncbi:thioredoxin domain-containing protein [Candidatus Roizmanbacteria bacterium]|nr:thioredoxin domain-containing protein [Candidatus Roizmanbacteria bacterium]